MTREEFETQEWYMIKVKNTTGRYVDIAGLYNKVMAEEQIKKYRDALPTHEFKLQPHKIKFKK